MMSEEDSDFDIITPTLIQQLKSILDQYPDDGQILKELIQNAEDAKAGVVKFVLDRANHPANLDKPSHPGLKYFQGAALYAYNDAVFTNTDWKGIRTICDSFKKDDPIKVGRFGLGFKSVFHITDLPSVVSGDRIGFIDPHQKYFNTEGGFRTGMSWKLEDAQNQKSDLFAPFQEDKLMSVLGHADDGFHKGSFKGTLFRFPLRIPECQSKISTESYPQEKIEDLFDLFQIEAYTSLLFLKYLERIELYERKHLGEIPKLIYKVELSKECLEPVRQKREEFLDEIKPVQWMSEPVYVSYPMTIVSSQNDDLSNEKWLVTNYYAGGDMSPVLQELVEDKTLGYSPWISVAMSLNDDSDNSEPRGHVFCFMPLPLEKKSITGLPIHVNGFLAVSQNRRHLKWPSMDQNEEHLTDKSLLWNKHMLADVVPQAYAELLSFAIHSRVATNAQVINAIPDIRLVDSKWNEMLEKFLNMVVNIPFLQSRNDVDLGGNSLNYNGASQDWMAISDVLFNNLGQEDHPVTVEKTLLLAEEPVVCVPEHINLIIETCKINVEQVDPRCLRNAVRSLQTSGLVEMLSVGERLELLKFAVKDQQFMELDGLTLLPLANKTFITFTSRSESSPIYLPTDDHPACLLPGLEDVLVDVSSHTQLVHSSLTKIAESGHTQVAKMDANALTRLLPRVFPAQWSSEDLVELDPSGRESGMVTISWLEGLWKYLVKTLPMSLAKVENLHILPLQLKGKIFLKRLTTTSDVIQISSDTGYLQPSLVQFLEQLGAHIVDDLYPFVGEHNKISHYVNSPDHEGVLQTISVLDRRRNACEIIRNLPLDVVRDFRRFVAESDAHIIEKYTTILRRLPIFDVTHGNSGVESSLASAADVPRASPEDLVLPLPSRMLSITDSDAKHLIGKLGVEVVSINEILCSYILPNFAGYATSQREKILEYVLPFFASKNPQNSSLKSRLQITPIATRSDGMMVTIASVFDPSDKDLQAMFKEQHVFPIGTCAQDQHLHTLKQLGLKTKSEVKASDILDAVKNITSGNTEEKEARCKAKAILTFLGENGGILQHYTSWCPLKDELSSIQWIPVKTTRPEKYPRQMHWFGEGKCFEQLSQVRNGCHSSIVGSTCPIADFDMIHMSLCPPDPCVDDVVGQLKTVVNAYCPDEKATFLPIVMDICTYFQEMCLPSEVLEALKKAEVHQWIWNGNGFSTSDHMVLELPPEVSDIELRPYLFSLPEELKKYKALFHSCGIRTMSLPEVTMKIQKQIKIKHTDGSFSEVEMEHDLSVIVNLLNTLKNDPATLTTDLLAELLLPVSSPYIFELMPLEFCTFDEESHFENDRDDIDDLHFVHGNVPVETCKVLRVQTLRNRVLDVDELNMSFMTSCGQHEPLTTRLQNILKDYTDGFAVPKEIIQNADDAGATEVKFLYDERTNEDALRSLIDRNMAQCQGPALWCYNNAVFTDTDIENITKLDGRTKETETEKIGVFGLGFNAVYNLTDVPSFVSRHYMVIFDPHCEYLGSAIKDKTQPGVKLNMHTKMAVKRMKALKDQFRPFKNVFGCDLEVYHGGEDKSYPGTLFRFPLRTREQAQKSKISTLEYDQREMKELLKLLYDGGSSLLLFTQNVRKVSVFHLQRDAEDPSNAKELFSITKNLEKTITPLSRGTFTPPLADDKEQELMENTRILQAVTKEMKFMRQHNQLTEMNQQSFPECSMVLSTSNCPTEDGKSFLKIVDDDNPETLWLVTSAMSHGPVLQMALEHGKVSPVSGIAAQLTRSHGNHYKPIYTLGDEHRVFKGNYYCFLPLPIQCGLPVHINGSFSVTSDRRFLYEKTSDDKEQFRANWNEALMTHAVPYTYLKMLGDVANLSEGGDVNFHQLWPRSLSACNSLCKQMLSVFYKTLFDTHRNDVMLFSDGESWECVNSVAMIEPDFLNSSIRCEVRNVLQDFLKQEGEILIDLPCDIQSCIQSVDCWKHVEPIIYDENRFFREVFFQQIPYIHDDDRDAIIVYALDSKSRTLHEYIKTNRCIPCDSNGTLKYPNELVDPNGLAGMLYDEEDGRFPIGEGYREPQRLAVLVHLGMNEDTLSAADILDRSKHIHKLSFIDVDKAKLRSNTLLRIITANQQSLWNIRNELLTVPFLIVKQKPKEYPFPWMAVENVATPEVVYQPIYQSLVSSTKCIIDSMSLHSVNIESKKFLGLDKKPQFLDVVHQLDKMISSTIAKTSVGIICNVCSEVYDYLREMMRKKTSEDIQIVATKEFVFIPEEAKFVSSACVSFAECDNLPPYSYTLPWQWELRQRELMKTLGVKTILDVSDYRNILEQMYHVHGDQPLGERELGVARKVVRNLATSLRGKRPEGIIYLPSFKGILTNSKDLCYNDAPWIPNKNMPFLDGDIPYDLAAQLGVNPKRAHVLRGFSRGIPFGQSEKLTNRIKRILDGYPCDKDIMKELLQNADDAGATEIHFVLDTRQHASKRLFGDKWKSLQGPALCVYNNRSFTSSDLAGIQNLGEGSKGDDPTKTGQYGVGFNAVYHLTDAPSFLTSVPGEGERLCVFDPHCLYVPEATMENPGICYDELPFLRETFPDVFDCYLEDKFPTDCGTMFRFPFRTDEMAAKSLIKHTVTTVASIKEMMHSFKDIAMECLLFVNNIKKISISEIDSTSGRLKNTYCVNAALDQTSETSRTEFYDFKKNVSSYVMTVKEIPVKEVSYEMSIQDNCGENQTWIIVKRLGFTKSDNVPIIVQNALDNGNIGLLPQGGVACLLHTTGAKIKEYRMFCFLPLPQRTALPVHINGHFALDHEARRNIWITTDGDVKTEWNRCLMGSVIAHAYVRLLQSAREYLLEAPMDRHMSCMKCDVLLKRMPLYLRLFPKTATDNVFHCASSSVYKIITHNKIPLLPVVRDADVEGTFGETVLPPFSCSLDVTPVKVISWFPPIDEGSNKAFFDNLYIPGISGTPLRNMLLDCKFNLIWSSFNILVKQFKLSQLPVSCATPAEILAFFKTYCLATPLCFIAKQNLPLPVENTQLLSISNVRMLLKFCHPDEKEKTQGEQTIECFFDLLDGAPLLVTADGKLRQFSGVSPVFVSKFSCLAPNYQAEFLHGQLSDLAIGESTSSKVFKHFDVASLSMRMPLPHEFHGQQQVFWNSVSSGGIPSESLVRRIWEMIKEETEFDMKDKKITERHVLQTLAPLMEWCLIPTQNTTLGKTQQVLVKMSRSKAVINGSRYGDKTSILLSKLGVPFLDITLVDCCLSSIFSSISHPEDVLTALLEQMNMTSFQDKLTNVEYTELLHYFVSHPAKDFLKHHNTLNRLKTLPFFIDVNGKQISISGRQAFVVPRGVPSDDMHIWEGNTHDAFLMQQGLLEMQQGLLGMKQGLLESSWSLLGCNELTPSELYCNFILRDFHLMSDTGRLAHMTYIKEHLSADKIIKAKLKSVRFLRGNDGALHTACEFYNLKHPVFKAMLDSHDFPPEPYNSWDWIGFMIEIGLINVVSIQKFIEFATTVENGTTLKKRYDKARTLLEHLFKRQDLLTSNILSKIRDIKFIPQERVASMYTEIHPQHGVTRDWETYICFRGSVPCKENDNRTNLHLTWTSAALLPGWVHQLYSKQCDNKGRIIHFNELCIDDKPTLLQVFNHCLNLCHIDISSNMQVTTCLLEVMNAIYQYMMHEEHQAEVQRLLKDHPTVLVEKGTMFVKANQLATDMKESEEIKPYLFKIPEGIAQFSKLFHLLGAAKEVTAEQYCTVLLKIHIECGGEKMDPNQIEKSKKAVKGLLSMSVGELNKTDYEGGLYLPSQSGMLVLSQTSVFIDKPEIHERILATFEHPILVNLDECELDEFDFESVLHKLPQEVRPLMLSDVAFERLEENLKMNAKASGELAVGLQQRLANEHFKKHVVRIIRHEDFSGNRKPMDDILNFVGKKLSNLSFYEIETLSTYIADKKGSRIKDSERDASLFIEKNVDEDNELRVNIYLKSGNSWSDSKLGIRLARAINSILGRILGESVLVLTCLLPLNVDPSTFSSLLDTLEIRPDGSIKTYTQRITPEIGSYIPITDHHLLQQDFDKFEIGEYVGYEIDDPVSRNEDGDATYIYAVVVEELSTPDENCLMKTYRIRVGDDRTIEAKATDLYKFVRLPRERCTDLAVYAGVGDGDHETDTPLDENIEDVKEQIKQMLKDAWKLPEEERRKIIKRLLFKWHPDKNPGRDKFCTEICQFIQQTITHLKEGRPDDVSSPFDYSSAFRRWNARGQRYSSQRSRWYQDFSSGGGDYTRRDGNSYYQRPSGFTSYDGPFYGHSRPTKNPQPNEAKRWMRQAKEDYRATNHDLYPADPSFEWACYKCFQSAEKALKAAQYAIDANMKSYSHDLVQLASSLEGYVDHDILSVASQLQSLLGNDMGMRYPDVTGCGRIPGEVYTHQMAEEARKLTGQILELISDFLSV